MKPIFVCHIKLKTLEEIEIIKNILESKLKEDYYTIVSSSNNNTGIRFELFNSELELKDFEDLKLTLKNK